MSISLISSCLVIISLFANGVSAGEYENLNNMAFANNALSMQYLSIAYFGCHLNPYPVFARFDCNGVISPQPVTFSESDFIASGYNPSVFDAINLLARRQYEQLDLVYSLIDDTASIIQPACNYTFSNTTTVADYLNNGLSLSNDMLAFYNDATSSVANQTLQMFAQVLAGAHARKAAYLRILLGNVVSPSSGLDPALPISEVSGSISSYLLQCANPPFQSQTIRPYGVAYSPNGTIYTGPRAEAARSNYTEENRQSDIASLRLLLTFESAQRGMYANLSAGGLSADAMRDAGFNAVTIRPQIDNFIAENLLHVTRLRQMISSLGGDDSECSYSFNLLLTGTLFALRMVFSLSSLNVKANSYVAGLIVDTNIQRQLAMMATIESRHNTLLVLLTNEYTGFTFNGYQTSAMPNALDDSSRSESSLRLLLGNVGVIETCAIPTFSSSSTGQSNNSTISSLSSIKSSSSSNFVTSQPEQSTGFDMQLSSTSVNSAVVVSEAMLLWAVLSAGLITVFW